MTHLSDAWPACICKDNTSNLFQNTRLTIPLDRSPDLLRARRDEESCLGFDALCYGLLGQTGDTVHVLITAVGAASNQSDLDFVLPSILLDHLGKLGQGRGQIRCEGPIDVGLEFRQVDLDHLVVDRTLVRPEELGVLAGGLSNGPTASGMEVGGHAVDKGEERGGGSNLGTHVADGAHSGTGQRVDSWSKVLDNVTRTSLLFYGQSSLG